MKQFSYTIVVLFFLVTCQKPERDDFSGERSVKGTLFINDTLNGLVQPRILAGRVVQIKLPVDSNSENYLTSEKTDAYGNFTFDNLSAGNYILYAKEDSNQISFQAKQPINLSLRDTIINLTLYPDSSKYNLLSVICQDTVGNHPLTGITVCFFTSRYASDSSNCVGSFTSGVSNIYGRLVITKVFPGMIYINALDSIGQKKIRAHDSVMMGPTGIRQKLITLK